MFSPSTPPKTSTCPYPPNFMFSFFISLSLKQNTQNQKSKQTKIPMKENVPKQNNTD